MLIRHLEFFVTLAEEGHFGRAADLCGVSQPALSLALRKLEDDLGMPLILRGQRYQGLTAEGEKVLLWGRQILADFGNLKADLSGRRKGGLTGTLRLGVSPAAMPLLPQFCDCFERRNPLARIEVAMLDQSQIEAGLTDFSLDGGLGWLPTRSTKADQMQRVPLWQVGLAFACRADHPFASGGPISLADAATQPLCQIADLAHPLREARQPAILCAGLDAVLAHLRSGAWCALVPTSLAHLLAEADDLRLIPLTDPHAGPLPMGGSLVGRAPQSPMVRAFADALTGLTQSHPNAATGLVG